jgi:hypothetical protein
MTLKQTLTAINTHVLWPVIGGAVTAILTHIAQGGDFTAHDLLLDAVGGALGVLATMWNPKGGKLQPFFIFKTEQVST